MSSCMICCPWEKIKNIAYTLVIWNIVPYDYYFTIIPKYHNYPMNNLFRLNI